MANEQEGPRSLPNRPNLRHLKDQAKDLLAAGAAGSLSDAQFKLARLYGFASWPKLKAHVESLEELGQLKLAIDAEDLAQVKTLMTRNRALHGAPLGYRKSGPLTWVAECRVPGGPPSPERLAMAKWMIDNGSQVHQGGDGPLMRAALEGERIPMMDLLVSQGADVNARCNGTFPIVLAPCETVDPHALKWLLEHGANPNCGQADRADTALDYLVGSYARSPRLGACIDILLDVGCPTRYDNVALDLIRGRVDLLAKHLDANPALVHASFPGLDCGATGARRLTLAGATLLHVAAEYGRLEAAVLLLERGARVDARATLGTAGIGGQTPIFHAVTQFDDHGLAVAELLIERNADLTLRVRLPGHYERPGEVVECTPLEYAELFPGVHGTTVALLRERAAVE